MLRDLSFTLGEQSCLALALDAMLWIDVAQVPLDCRFRSYQMKARRSQWQ
jgi:hypothetical protein